MRIAGVVAALSMTASARGATQQVDPSLVGRFHAAAVAHIAGLSQRPVAPGDTLVTWAKQGPVLFHIVATTPGSVQSSLLRNDRLVGEATSQWGGHQLQSYEVSWAASDSAPLVVHVQKSGNTLIISGSRDTVLAIPTGTWAIADYGMEEQLVPVLRAIGVRGATDSISVFRPYGLKWDTVGVTIHADSGALLITADRGHPDQSLLVIDALGRLVLAYRFDGTAERRPLEGTALYDSALPLLRRVRPR